MTSEGKQRDQGPKPQRQGMVPNTISGLAPEKGLGSGVKMAANPRGD